MSSILLNKSNENQEVARLLFDKKYYTSSIHCSYYSFIQLIRHHLFNSLSHDEKNYDEEAKKNKDGSHEKLIKDFLSNIDGIKKLKFKNEYLELNNNFRTIKILRHNSDYKTFKINFDHCTNAIDISIKLNETLNKLCT